MLRNRGNTALALSGSAAEPFGEAEEANARPFLMVDDKQAAWERNRFWQQEDKTLHLAPLPFFPGIILAPGAEIPPANSRLWVRLQYQLQSADYGFESPGWSGAITQSRAELVWSRDNLTASNVIFPGDKASSLPPGRALILHYQLGRTGADQTFSFEILGLDTSTPLLTPPL